MKFHFEDEYGKSSLSNQSTGIQHSQTDIIQTSCVQPYRHHDINIKNLDSYHQVKNQLVGAVDTFKNQIQHQLKIQQLLKKEIRLLTIQQYNYNREFNQKINHVQTHLQPQNAISSNPVHEKAIQASIDQQQKVEPQGKTDSRERIKSKSRKQSQNASKARSLKGELMSKGYPVVHKTKAPLQQRTCNKNKLPYRFKLN